MLVPDADLLEPITTSIGNGLQRDFAFRKAGIAQAIQLDWEARAIDGEEPYLSFINAIVEAEMEILEQATSKLVKGKDQRGIAKWLEANVPDIYGQRIQIEVRHEIDRVLRIVHEESDPIVFARICKRLAQRGNGHAGARVPRSDQTGSEYLLETKRAGDGAGDPPLGSAS